jgi:hypothetical protein
MSQSGYTPIQLYRSSTASAAPTAGNLADGELAINTADGKLFYKDSSANVQVLAVKMPSSILPVSNGGTGLSSATAYSVLAGGTTSTGALQSVSGTGTSGQVLTSNGASALPTWQTASGGVTKGQSIAFSIVFGL